jgi:hypothetical protein
MVDALIKRVILLYILIIEAIMNNQSASVEAVVHDQFTMLPVDHWPQLLPANTVLLDFKGFLPRELSALRL